MVFLHVPMAFSVRLTPKQAKQGIYNLLYTFYIIHSINLTRKARDPYVFGKKNDKIRLIMPFLRFIEGVE